MGTLYANPLRNPAAWDFITVSGVKSPGVFRLIGGAERRYKWDCKDTAGAQGGTSTYQGWKPADGIRGRIELWTPEQVDELYDVFLPVIRIDALKKKPNPVSVQYPPLMANDIVSLVTKSIGPLAHDGRQLWVIEIEWGEYKPPAPKNVTATPLVLDSDKRLAGPGKPPATAQDAQDVQIVQLHTTAGLTGLSPSQFRTPGNPSAP